MTAIIYNIKFQKRSLSSFLYKEPIRGAKKPLIFHPSWVRIVPYLVKNDLTNIFINFSLTTFSLQSNFNNFSNPRVQWSTFALQHTKNKFSPIIRGRRNSPFFSKVAISKKKMYLYVDKKPKKKCKAFK